MPVRTATAKVNPSTAGTMRTSATRGKESGAAATKVEVPQSASNTPRAPPKNDSKTLSVRNCRNSLARDAPTASRMASSRVRADPFASKRFATLLQAMRSNRPTAASRISKGSRTSPTTHSRMGTRLAQFFALVSGNCRCKVSATRSMSF